MFVAHISIFLSPLMLSQRFTDDPVHDPSAYCFIYEIWFTETSYRYAATRGLFYSHMGWIFFKPTYERMGLVERDDLEKDLGGWNI